MNEWQLLEISAIGSSIDVWIDGNLVLSAIDEEFSEGVIGLWCRGMAPMKWDNLMISAPHLPGFDPWADAIIDAAIQPGNQGNDRPDPGSILGMPDNVSTCLGGVCAGNAGPAWVKIDMGAGEGIFNGLGDDFEILEIGPAGGGVNESYEVWLANDPSGPWSRLGIGVGNSTFDLSVINLDYARYLRLDDLSDLTCNTMTPGCDIDGVISYYTGPPEEWLRTPTQAEIRLTESEPCVVWYPRPGAASYLVEGSADPLSGGRSWTPLGTTSDTTWTLGTIAGDSLYLYRVRSLIP